MELLNKVLYMLEISHLLLLLLLLLLLHFCKRRGVFLNPPRIEGGGGSFLPVA